MTEDQVRANALSAGMLEALAAALRSGSASVVAAEFANGTREKSGEPADFVAYEYDGRGSVVMQIAVEAGPAWFGGHPFERRRLEVGRLGDEGQA